MSVFALGVTTTFSCCQGLSGTGATSTSGTGSFTTGANLEVNYVLQVQRDTHTTHACRSGHAQPERENSKDTYYRLGLKQCQWHGPGPDNHGTAQRTTSCVVRWVVAYTIIVSDTVKTCT